LNNRFMPLLSLKSVLLLPLFLYTTFDTASVTPATGGSAGNGNRCIDLLNKAEQLSIKHNLGNRQGFGEAIKWCEILSSGNDRNQGEGMARITGPDKDKWRDTYKKAIPVEVLDAWIAFYECAKNLSARNPSAQCRIDLLEAIKDLIS
jgi:hypothetical protein